MSCHRPLKAGSEGGREGRGKRGRGRVNEPSGATLCPFFANDIFCVICFNENVNENEKLLECVSLAGRTHTHRHSQINMPRPRLAICLPRTVAVVVVDVVRIVPTMERTCNSQKQLGWQLKQAPPLPRPPPSSPLRLPLAGCLWHGNVQGGFP